MSDFNLSAQNIRKQVLRFVAFCLTILLLGSSGTVSSQSQRPTRGSLEHPSTAAPFQAGLRGIGDLQADGDSLELNEDPMLEALDRLISSSLREVDVHFEGGIPRFVAAQVPASEAFTNDPVAQALAFLEDYKELYRLSDPSAQLFLDRLEKADIVGPMFHVFFSQRHGSVPVWGSALAVHIEDGAITGTNGNYLVNIPHLPPPALASADAEGIAVQDTNAAEVSVSGKSALNYYDNSLFVGGAVDTRLAWNVRLRGAYLYRQYMVDAHNGEILLALDLEQDSGPDKDFDIETANFGPSPWCYMLTTYDEQWFDEDGPVSGATPDAEGWSAFASTHQVYDYFFDNFHRHSYDGDEEDVEIYLDARLEGISAHYESGCDIFEFSNDMAVLDVLAHEYTHGVTSSSAELVYRDQSGALNESFSDFFAEVIDEGDWSLGDLSALGAMRDMEDPPRFGDPDHMLASVSGDGFGLRPPPPGSRRDDSNDNGFVHTNSGIPNKVGYLLVEGGEHNALSIPDLGVEKAQRLFYDTLVFRLTSNAQFIDARNAMVAQATGYAFGGAFGFNATDVCSVINAWASVGLGTSTDRDCDGIEDGSDPDRDGDFVRDTTDNCDTIRNPRQEDTDADGEGDACDSDLDGDGIDNIDDNCAQVDNPGQEDSDGDGVGDACDDDDDDGVPFSDDNCRTVSNPGQENSDDDGLGDACDTDDDNDDVADLLDNCQYTANPGQEDIDGDGVGDACDNCQTVPNPDQSDIDDDDLGDACDDDADGDGVPNDEDRCVYGFDPHNFDFDEDGVGFVCDEDEQMLFSPPAGDIQFDIRFEDIDEPLAIPIFPCLADGCDDWHLGLPFLSIELEMPLPLYTQVVDQTGRVINKGGLNSLATLSFEPDIDHHYLPPFSSHHDMHTNSVLNGDVYLGHSYFLKIYPTEEVVANQIYTLELDMWNSREGILYLPMLTNR